MTSPIKPLGGKRLTKDDIEKLRQSLPKRMDITPEGVTTSCEDSEEAIAPILEDKAPQVEVPLSAEEIRAFQVSRGSLLRTLWVRVWSSTENTVIISGSTAGMVLREI